MDREINERAVISTGAQRGEVFYSDGGTDKLSIAILSVCACICTLYLCVGVHVHVCVLLTVCTWIVKKKGQKRQNKRERH